MQKDDFGKLAKDTFEILNKARGDPAWVAQELAKYRNFFKGKEYKNPALGFTFETQEGAKALDDAIDFLKKKVYPQKPLGRSAALDGAAQALVAHFDQTGGTGPASEEFQLQSRLKKALGSVKSMAESSSFGFNDPKEIVFQLIIDDGVATRANRKNLYSPSFNEAGIALGTHKDYGYVCVIDFHGDGKKEEKAMEKYHLPKNEWPADAVSLQMNLEMKTDGTKKVIKATYNFTLANKGTQTLTKEFTEDL